MIPFKVDPSWYERYWWSDPAPDRTAYRADKACRERLLRAAGAMKVALDSLVRTVECSPAGSRDRADRSAWSIPEEEAATHCERTRGDAEKTWRSLP